MWTKIVQFQKKKFTHVWSSNFEHNNSLAPKLYVHHSKTQFQMYYETFNCFFFHFIFVLKRSFLGLFFWWKEFSDLLQKWWRLRIYITASLESRIIGTCDELIHSISNANPVDSAHMRPSHNCKYYIWTILRRNKTITLLNVIKITERFCTI